MDDVAAEVGIRRASLVYYYPDKRQLYRALIDDLFSGLLHRYQAVLAGPGTPRERFVGCVDVWSEQVIERPGLLRVLMWELARVPPLVNPLLVEDLAPIIVALSEVIASGQREGLFLPVDPVRFMMILAGATAFLTVGMGAIVVGGRPLGVHDLREQLRTVTDRMLFVD